MAVHYGRATGGGRERPCGLSQPIARIPVRAVPLSASARRYPVRAVRRGVVQVTDRWCPPAGTVVERGAPAWARGHVRRLGRRTDEVSRLRTAVVGLDLPRPRGGQLAVAVDVAPRRGMFPIRVAAPGGPSPRLSPRLTTNHAREPTGLRSVYERGQILAGTDTETDAISRHQGILPTRSSPGPSRFPWPPHVSWIVRRKGLRRGVRVGSIQPGGIHAGMPSAPNWTCQSLWWSSR